MASGNFSKGSKEWQMFTDFWMIAKKYWIPEANDEYWECLVHDVTEFSDKYTDIPLAHKVGVAFIETVDHQYHGRTDRDAVRKAEDAADRERERRTYERARREIC